ncbi:Hypothetical_protein [Hexamita inflata]|uniref:Hypothetical_protein n=1 Tax=Hexamita inflata TaxID=28002 RepID=A0AA86TE50_9EUKA|nr:Hypothetical protein HINF_LOCUS2596 [Hexamita inflata]
MKQVEENQQQAASIMEIKEELNILKGKQPKLQKFSEVVNKQENEVELQSEFRQFSRPTPQQDEVSESSKQCENLYYKPRKTLGSREERKKQIMLEKLANQQSNQQPNYQFNQFNSAQKFNPLDQVTQSSQKVNQFYSNQQNYFQQNASTPVFHIKPNNCFSQNSQFDDPSAPNQNKNTFENQIQCDSVPNAFCQKQQQKQNGRLTFKRIQTNEIFQREIANNIKLKEQKLNQLQTIKREQINKLNQIIVQQKQLFRIKQTQQSLNSFYNEVKNRFDQLKEQQLKLIVNQHLQQALSNIQTEVYKIIEFGMKK